MSRFIHFLRHTWFPLLIRKDFYYRISEIFLHNTYNDKSATRARKKKSLKYHLDHVCHIAFSTEKYTQKNIYIKLLKIYQIEVFIKQINRWFQRTFGKSLKR